MLLRVAHPAAEQHALCSTSVHKLISDGVLLHFTLQNATEFWNVSTRPVIRNGFGLPIAVVNLAWAEVERNLALLPDDAQVYGTWRTLVETHQVRGVQVHDAHLAASMLVHNVPYILTLNTADFVRYPGLEAVHPRKV